MEDKELFIQYHELKKEYIKAKYDYDKALDKKAEYLYSVLPGASNTESEMIKGSVSDKLLNYTIKSAEIEKEIEVRRNLMDNLSYRLKLKALELRSSKELLDKIYMYRYIDRVRVNKFCRLIGYSREQTYRKIKEIEEKLKMTQNDTKLVVQ